MATCSYISAKAVIVSLFNLSLLPLMVVAEYSSSSLLKKPIGAALGATCSYILTMALILSLSLINHFHPLWWWLGILCPHCIVDILTQLLGSLVASTGLHLSVCLWMLIVATGLAPLTWLGTPKVSNHVQLTWLGTPKVSNHVPLTWLGKPCPTHLAKHT